MALAGKVLLAAMLAYTAVCLLVWAIQDRLVFYPRPVTGTRTAPAGWRLETIRFPSGDDAVLAGVLVLPPGPPAPLLVYFGGNAEEVTEAAPTAEEAWGKRAVLLVNYRGYGDSTGKPSEQHVVADALRLLEWARARSDVDGSRVALHGRSLGTGVATQVAAATAVRCVVLTSPLASAVDVAREAYPWLPVSLLLRHPFDSVAYAPRARAPALVLIGDADTLIRPNHSQRLAAAWGGPVTVVRIAGGGHNDLDLDPAYGRGVRDFLLGHH